MRDWMIPVVFVAIFLICLFEGVNARVRDGLRDGQDCEARGGVYVHTSSGHACLDVQRKQ